AVHDELTTAVISGGTVVDLVSTLSRRLERRVWALDEAGRPLLSRAGDERHLPRRTLLKDAASRSHASGHAETIATSDGRWIIAAIPGADRVLGSVITEVISESDEPSSEEVSRRMLERAAQVAAIVSFKREAI